MTPLETLLRISTLQAELAAVARSVNPEVGRIVRHAASVLNLVRSHDVLPTGQHDVGQTDKKEASDVAQ